MITPGDVTECGELRRDFLANRDLIIVSNRGPCSFQTGEDGAVKVQRSGGGLVTALLGLAKQVPSTWIACAMSDADRAWSLGSIPLDEGNVHGDQLQIRFINPQAKAYEDYYQVISNPLLWFLQHAIWDFSRTPTVNVETWKAWDDGYTAVNRLFADAVVDQVQQNDRPSIVMLQDYHLYLAPRMIRQRLNRRYQTNRNLRRSTILTHFIHIPWPGPEDWGLLPRQMREAILDGLCAVDLVGFQTREDALNFIRTCESLLPEARVNYRMGRVTLHNHATHVRDFPISIDVKALHEEGKKEEVQQFREQLLEAIGERKVIVRIDRTEPSKNIVRGFQAYEEMLEMHPEHMGKVQFLALLVPSRLEVEEYQNYLNAIMAAAGRVNARFGSSEWEPVRVLVGESYPRALAAMQIYDVLLVNPVADGMNLVAKEGPTVNETAGVVVLSERAGAHQQLGENALVIAPVDVSATAEALHCALIMPAEERKRRSHELKREIAQEDIHVWLCWQLDALQSLENTTLEKKQLVPY
jgi:trehalose 6-phosphate synthase